MARLLIVDGVLPNEEFPFLGDFKFSAEELEFLGIADQLRGDVAGRDQLGAFLVKNREFLRGKDHKDAAGFLEFLRGERAFESAILEVAVRVEKAESFEYVATLDYDLEDAIKRWSLEKGRKGA